MPRHDFFLWTRAPGARGRNPAKHAVTHGEMFWITPVISALKAFGVACHGHPRPEAFQA